MSIVLNGSGQIIVQVQSTFKANSFSSSSTSYVDITDLSVSITPSSASNKILVMASVTIGNAGGNGLLNLVRNSTNIAQSINGTVNQTVAANVATAYQTITYPIMFLDSPATTSATTYKIQLNTAGSTVYINLRGTDNYYGGVSSITVMEISG
jgi:chlorite dismutase